MPLEGAGRSCGRDAFLRMGMNGREPGMTTSQDESTTASTFERTDCGSGSEQGTKSDQNRDLSR